MLENTKINKLQTTSENNNKKCPFANHERSYLVTKCSHTGNSLQENSPSLSLEEPPSC